MGLLRKQGVALKFEVEYLNLEDRKAAHDWIINNQLGRRNVTPEQASYLRGKRYNSEKLNVGRQEHIFGQNVHINRTAEKLGQEYNVDEKTIRRDAKFAEAVDTIADNAGEDARRTILNGSAARAITLKWRGIGEGAGRCTPTP